MVSPTAITNPAPVCAASAAYCCNLKQQPPAPTIAYSTKAQ